MGTPRSARSGAFCLGTTPMPELLDKQPVSDDK
jgi:hypothetical protein